MAYTGALTMITVLLGEVLGTLILSEVDVSGKSCIERTMYHI